jgi:hypothetical protein
MKPKERRWLRQRACLVLSCIILGTLVVFSQRNNAITRHSFQLPAALSTATPSIATPELTLIVPSTFQDFQCYSSRFFSILYNDILDPPEEIIIIVSQVPSHASPRLDYPPPPLKLKNKINIKILSFQSQQSASQNRNIGAYIATGNVLTFFDIDDLPHPQRFQIIKKLFNDNPHVDAAVFNYVNGTHADGAKHKFKHIDVENLPLHYDIGKLKKAYQQYWREHPEFHPNYFELWCCRPVDKYMANGWGTYRRHVFLEYKYKEGLKSGEDTDLNARLIFNKNVGFTFWEDLKLGFYEMVESVDSDGDFELKGKSALDMASNEKKKNTCPFSSASKIKNKLSESAVGKLVCPTPSSTTSSSTCSPTSSSSTNTKSKAGEVVQLGNPHDALPSELCRPLLFAGCGYSGTGFLGKLFSSAGYDVPHECLGKDGTSDWRYSFEMKRPLPFEHVYMQVRHPLAVVASWYSVQWNFTVDKTWKECQYNDWKLEELDVRDYFKAGDLNYLSREVQALEWWSQAVSRVLPAVECWWKIEDFSSEMAEAVCERAGFVGCSVPDWNRLIKEHENENSHREEDRNAPKPTWETLCGKEQRQKDDSRSKRGRVCERARALCREFNFDDC